MYICDIYTIHVVQVQVLVYSHLHFNENTIYNKMFIYNLNNFKLICRSNIIRIKY